LKPINNEKGAALIVALVITGLLMVIGTAIVMTSTIELNIARNEKAAQTAFYRSENGRVIAAEVTESAAWGIEYNDNDNFEGNTDIIIADGDFIMESNNDADTPPANPDLHMTGSLAADVDIDKLSTQPLPGSAAKFGTGYEGAGKMGSVQIICRVNSFGSGSDSASAHIRTDYRLVPQ
jgi:Tfp pilus assembly protein PilX